MGTEIQLHNTIIKGDIVEVDYSLVNDLGTANVNLFQIRVSSLVDYITSTSVSFITRLHAEIFLTENTRKVVGWYLEDQLV